MTNQLAAIEHAKQKAIDLGMEYGPKVLVAAAILVGGIFASRWVAGVVERWLSKIEMEPPVRQLILRLVRVLVVLLFLLIALTNLEVKLLPLIAGLGVAGAGVAFAMQGVLGNLFAGLMIIFTRPFRVGEYVSMVGVEGRVESIELFSTKLSHADRSRIVVPNRKIVGEILHNYGKIRQLDVFVGVAYSTDLNAALEAVRDVLNRNPLVLKDPEPVVRVSVLSDSSINIAIKPWVPVLAFGQAGGEINKAVVEEFRVRKISIPFPQREIRVLNEVALGTSRIQTGRPLISKRRPRIDGRPFRFEGKLAQPAPEGVRMAQGGGVDRNSSPGWNSLPPTRKPIDGLVVATGALRPRPGNASRDCDAKPIDTPM